MPSSLFHWASSAVVLTGAIEDRAGLGDAIARLGELASITQERMSLRTAVFVACSSQMNSLLDSVPSLRSLLSYTGTCGAMPLSCTICPSMGAVP